MNDVFGGGLIQLLGRDPKLGFRLGEFLFGNGVTHFPNVSLQGGFHGTVPQPPLFILA
jgi:hypothetical protein